MDFRSSLEKKEKGLAALNEFVYQDGEKHLLLEKAMIELVTLIMTKYGLNSLVSLNEEMAIKDGLCSCVNSMQGFIEDPNNEENLTDLLLKGIEAFESCQSNYIFCIEFKTHQDQICRHALLTNRLQYLANKFNILNCNIVKENNFFNPANELVRPFGIFRHNLLLLSSLIYKLYLSKIRYYKKLKPKIPKAMEGMPYLYPGCNDDQMKYIEKYMIPGKLFF